MRTLAVDFQGGLSDAWVSVATFVPKLVAALVIFLIGYFVAKVLANLLNRVLERVGFDRAVERGGLRRVLARSKYDPSDILAKLVYWAVLLFTLQLAFGVFGPNPVSDLLGGIIAYLPNVFIAIVILVIAGAVAKGVRDLLENVLSGAPYGRQLAMGAGIAIVVIGVFAALDQLNIAESIVNGLWIALLAIVVGSAVISFGVGGIPIARRYLERAAQRAERQGGELRSAVAENTRSRPSPPETGPTTPNRPYDPPSRPFDDPPGSRRMP
jgi:hypothetical protein